MRTYEHTKRSEKVDNSVNGSLPHLVSAYFRGSRDAVQEIGA